MYRPFMRLANKALFLSAALMSFSSLAGKDDFKEQIEILSNNQIVEGKNKTYIISDNVHIRQGTLNIYADVVDVNAASGDGNEVFIARGKPASFEQTLEDGSTIKAVANTIEYQREFRTLRLNGSAELLQDSSQVTGESISYNMELEQVIAQGSDSEDGRVRTIFQPSVLKKTTDESESAEKTESTDPEKDKQP